MPLPPPPLHSPGVLWGRGSVAGVEVTVAVCYHEGRVDAEEILCHRPLSLQDLRRSPPGESYHMLVGSVVIKKCCIPYPVPDIITHLEELLV